MAESFSVQAILSAVDKGFRSTMKDAKQQAGGLADENKKANTSMLDIAKGVGVFKLVEMGVSAVTNSVGGAVSRFDTLNKYPTVMQALGYSADEVTDSMSKLDKGIDGLPTSMDEIVASTQQIAIATGDLEKGTDTAIALNNAFLASGASSADASRGAEQYIQMLSKGEVDLQSWRTLQETMPIAMDKVAKSFEDRGVKSVNELYEALKEGDITFDEFNDRMLELNEGVGGFADLATKNSKGIATSFKNVRTAIVKGVEKTIRAVDEALQGAGFGSIADNFDKLKDMINQFFSWVVSIVPTIVSVLMGVVNVLKFLSPILVPLLALVVTYQTIIGAVTAATKVWAAAQALVNAVLAINPFVLIIAAIIAFVGWIIYLWKTNEGFRNAIIVIWESIKETISNTAEAIANIWGALKDNLMMIWNAIKTGASSIWEGIKNIVTGVAKAIVSIVKAQFEWQKQIVMTIWNAISSFASSVWNTIKNTVTNLAKGAVNGLKNAWDKGLQWTKDIFNNIKRSVVSIGDVNLFAAGKAIIDSFIDGLKQTWEAGKKFVGGIADWIREHKGPVSYDKKLLIDNGEAIMGGLNKGLISGFDSVKATIANATDYFTNSPIEADVDIMSNVSDLNNRLSNANMSLSNNSELTLNEAKKPMELNLRLGNQNFKAFVDDISNVMAIETDLELQN